MEPGWDQLLPDSGLAAYRNDKGDYLLFRASDFGYKDCPHSHDAPLSVILFLQNQPVLVDAGAGAYTQLKSVRDTFRSAPASNSILVDGFGSSRPGGWFSWESTSDAELAAAQATGYGFFCSGRQVRLTRAGAKVELRRSVRFADRGVVAIEDEWFSDAPVEVQAFWTLHPGCSAEVSQTSLNLPDGSILYYGTFGGESLERHDIAVIPVPFSETYGRISQSLALSYVAAAAQRGRCVTVFSRNNRIDEGMVERIERDFPKCAGFAAS